MNLLLNLLADFSRSLFPLCMNDQVTPAALRRAAQTNRLRCQPALPAHCDSANDNLYQPQPLPRH